MIKYFVPTSRLMWFSLFLTVSSATLFAQATPGTPSPMNGETGVQCNPKLSWSMGGTNLIVNGGFEAPLSLSWGNNLGLIRFTTTNSLEGTNCLVLVAPSGGVIEAYQDVQCPSDCDYLSLSWGYYFDANPGPVDPSAYLRLELRDSSNQSVAELANITPEPNRTRSWNYRSVNLSRWRGQKVRLVFQSNDQRWVPFVDNIRLEAYTANNRIFQLFSGASSNVNDMVSLGLTTLPSWNLDRLAAGSTNYWRVDTILNGITNSGPVWSFVVGPTGALHHLSASPIPNGIPTNEPVRISITAEDQYNNLSSGYNGLATIRAFSESGAQPHIIISEVGKTDSGDDGVEFMNPLETTNDLSGWQVLVYDATSTSKPRFGVTLPPGTLVPPGGLFVVRETKYQTYLPVPQFPCSQIDWASNGTVTSGVVLLDPRSNIVDCLLMGTLNATNIQEPVKLTALDWRGAPVILGSGCARRGNKDSGTDRDWVRAVGTFGYTNGSLQTPFSWGFGELPVTTSSPVELKDGVWSGEIRFGALASNAWLTVSAPDVLERRGFPFDILPGAGIDTDGDSMPDEWENAHGLVAAKADAEEDPDGDGASNLLEYVSDTNPRSASSCPRLVLSRATQGGARLDFACRAGLRFRIEATHDLASGPWETIVQSISSGGIQSHNLQDLNASTYLRVRFGP